MARSPARVRRTPEEARRHILAAARQRLVDVGLSGLRLADIAADAGVTHSNIIHHFGSSAGLKQALFEAMSDDLIRDILAHMQDEGTESDRVDAVLHATFATFRDGAHARLLGWMLMEDADGAGGVDHVVKNLTPMFDRLVERMVSLRATLHGVPADAAARRRARYIALLVTLAAMGEGLSQRLLPACLHLDEKDVAEGFPLWLGQLLIGAHDPAPADEAVPGPQAPDSGESL